MKKLNYNNLEQVQFKKQIIGYVNYQILQILKYQWKLFKEHKLYKIINKIHLHKYKKHLHKNK